MLESIQDHNYSDLFGFVRWLPSSKMVKSSATCSICANDKGLYLFYIDVCGLMRSRTGILLKAAADHCYFSASMPSGVLDQITSFTLFLLSSENPQVQS